MGESVKQGASFDKASGSRSSDVDLAALLRRGDIWRGHSQSFIRQNGVDTGFENLNKALLHKGWPEACLIEYIQSDSTATWVLMLHAAKQVLRNSQGLMVMLNPPEMPYAPALLQMGLSTKQLIVVNTPSKSDFIACFVELSRAEACQVLLAWPPVQALSYAELRKCQLAATNQSGLYCLFRSPFALRSSSPAALRVQLELRADSLYITVLKQRGYLAERSLYVPLPDHWFPEPAYVDLESDSVNSGLKNTPACEQRHIQARRETPSSRNENTQASLASVIHLPRHSKPSS